MTGNEKSVWTQIRFRQTVGNLVKYGPSIGVGVGPAPFLGTRRIDVLAKIDTGAGGSGISPRLARKLNLNPIDRGEIHEAGREPIVAHYFRVRLFLASIDIDIDIVGLPSLGEPHDVLIGRDVLANCRLAIDFTSGATALHIRSD